MKNVINCVEDSSILVPLLRKSQYELIFLNLVFLDKESMHSFMIHLVMPSLNDEVILCIYLYEEVEFYRVGISIIKLPKII